MTDNGHYVGNAGIPMLAAVEDAEKDFLSGKRRRGADLESAVRLFLEFLRGFEALELEGPCVTVFGSARFPDGHPYYETARQLGAQLAKAGVAAAVLTLPDSIAWLLNVRGGDVARSPLPLSFAIFLILS